MFVFIISNDDYDDERISYFINIYFQWNKAIVNRHCKDRRQSFFYPTSWMKFGIKMAALTQNERRVQ